MQPGSGHTNGFSPVWLNVCIRSDEGLENDFWHSWHMYRSDGDAECVRWLIAKAEVRWDDEPGGIKDGGGRGWMC